MADKEVIADRAPSSMHMADKEVIELKISDEW
jgi:hypothetical protein